MKASYFGEPSTFALVHCNYEKYSKVTKFPLTSAVAEQTSFRKNKHNPSHLFAVVWHESFTFLQIVLGSFLFLINNETKNLFSCGMKHVFFSFWRISTQEKAWEWPC